MIGLELTHTISVPNDVELNNDRIGVPIFGTKRLEGYNGRYDD